MQVMETGEPNIEVRTFKVYRRKKRTKKKKEGSGEKNKSEEHVGVEVAKVAGSSELESIKKIGESGMPFSLVNDGNHCYVQLLDQGTKGQSAENN